MPINPLATPWVVVCYSVTRGAIPPLIPAHRIKKKTFACPKSIPFYSFSPYPPMFCLENWASQITGTLFQQLVSRQQGSCVWGSCVSKHHGVTQFSIPRRPARCRKLRSLNEEWQCCPRRPSVVNLTHECVPGRLEEADRLEKNTFTPALWSHQYLCQLCMNQRKTHWV